MSQGVVLQVIDSQAVDGYSERVGELHAAGIDVCSQCGRGDGYHMHSSLLLNLSVIQQNMAGQIGNYQNGQQNMDYSPCFHNMQM